MKAFLTERQVAELVGLSRSTLAKYRMKGGSGPKFVRFGAAVRYPADAVQEWVDAHPRLASTADLAAQAAQGREA